jgi:hypothetical protein
MFLAASNGEMPRPMTVRLYDDPTLVIDYISKSHNPTMMVFTFTERDNVDLQGVGFGGDFILDNGFDVVAIKSSSRLWFEELSDEIVATVNAALVKHPRIVRAAYASSMGGYAAMRFSRLFAIDRVVAISPLYDIRMPEDERYKEDIPGLKHAGMMAPEWVNPRCDYFIIYDPFSIDSIHVAKYCSIIRGERLHLIKVPYSGHPSGYFLSEIGILKKIATSVLLGERKEVRDYDFKKRHSPSYLFNLSTALHQSGKFHWALKVALAACALSPKNTEFLTLLSRIYTSLGEWEKAKQSALSAISLDPDNNHRNLVLVEVLAAMGDAQAAVGVLDGMIATEPSVGHYQYLRGIYSNAGP